MSSEDHTLENAVRYTIQVHSATLPHHLSDCFSLTPSPFVYCFTPPLLLCYFCGESPRFLLCIRKQPSPLVWIWRRLFDRYMCVWQHSADLYPSTSVLKRFICFAQLCEKKRYSKVVIFLWPNSLYTRLKVIPYRKIFPTIYNMPGLLSIYLLTKNSRNHPERLTKC